MVIDFHTHAFPDDLAARAVPVLAEKAGIPACLDGTVSGIRQSMTRSRIGYSLILPIATKPKQTGSINNWAIGINGGGIISFGTLHPDNADWKDELARISDAGLKGIKLHPDYQDFYVDEKRMFPIYEELQRLGLITVFHAGVDLGFKPPFRCTPARLAKVLAAFPGCRFVAAHMGGFMYWEQVEELLAGTQLYMDTSYCIGHMDMPQLARILERHDPSRILFGSDSPWKDQSEELDRLCGLGLDDGTLDAILGGNAAMLLGLPD